MFILLLIIFRCIIIILIIFGDFVACIKRVAYSTACGCLAGGLVLASFGTLACVALLFPQISRMPQILGKKWFGATLLLSGLATATIAEVARRQLKPQSKRSSDVAYNHSISFNNQIYNDDSQKIDDPMQLLIDLEIPVGPPPENFAITSPAGMFPLTVQINDTEITINEDASDEDWIALLQKLPICDLCDLQNGQMQRYAFFVLSVIERSYTKQAQSDTLKLLVESMECFASGTMTLASPVLRYIYLKTLEKDLTLKEFEVVKNVLTNNDLSLETLQKNEAAIRRLCQKGKQCHADSITPLTVTVLGHLRALHYFLIEQIRKQQQPQRHNVKGDGNCLYRAIAHSAYQDEKRWKEVKKAMLDADKNDSDFIKEYSPDKKWGNNLSCCIYLAEALQRPIYLYEGGDVSSNQENCNPRVFWPSQPTPELSPLFIYLRGGLGNSGHFQAVNLTVT